MAEIFDTYNYMAYPQTIVGFSEELIKIIDDYMARKISNAELKEIILFYAETNAGKLFNGADYNITVKRLIGKKRIDVLNTILEGYQQRFKTR